MTFLQPWWWLLALLAIPLVLWHARNPRNLTVPSVRIWKAIAPDAARPNLDVRRFHWRPDRSLWVQLLALLALVIALAGPRPSDGVYDHHVWVLDRSASMAAPHGDETRWDAAVMEAVEALGASDAAVRGGPVNSVVTMGSDVSVAVARSDVRAHAARRIETTSVEDARAPVPASRVREAVRAVMVPNERTRITVLTDASGVAAANDALDSWAERDDGPVEVEIATFGETHRTHGFGSVRAVPLSPEDGEWRIEGEVLAYPPPEETLTVRARFERDDVEGALPWEALEVRLDGERTPFSFETEFPSAGVLTLSLPDDVLPGDDVARLALRDTPVQLRAWIAGEVPERLVEALEALDSTQVVRANGEVAGPPDAEAFDLAVVGPQANMDGRPAPTVLWLAGTSSEGEGASRLEAPAHVWSAGGSAAWTGVEDVPAGALDEVYELPSADHAEVLLRSEQGPLLQVRTSAHGTDIEAAWALGETVWARELGFATFLSEVSAMAQPRHGSWTDTRCIVGQPCPTASGDVAMEAPGVYEVSGTRWIVDVEAGPESNLQAEPPDVGGSNGLHVTAPWDRLDRSLAGIAALLLAFDAVRAWRRRRHGRRTVSPLRYWGAVALRIAAVVAAAFMAVGVPAPEVRFTEESVMVFDPSAWSGGSGAEGVQERWGRAARRGGASVWADGLGRLEAAGPWEEDLPSTRREAAAYDLAGVLRTAAATLGSSGGRLIVAGASGENGTVAHGLRDDLRARAVTVDVVPPPPLGDGEAWVTHIDVPDTIRSGDSVTVRVGVEGADATGRRVTVTVDGEVLARDEDAGPRAYSWEAPEPGSYELRAELAGDEAAGVPDNDVRRELVTVEPAGRVALVVVEEAERKVLGGRLEAQGFEVVAWRPRDVPASVDGFLAFDVVVVSDVPAVDLHPSRQESLERWVREHGGGVVVAGAKRAFGPGGYLRTPLEDLSPLSARVPGEQPQAAIAFVLDRSGSMQQTVGGISRLALTKRATADAVDLLHPESQVSIVVFDDVAHLLKPLGPPEDVASRLEAVTPGGGTNLYPGLESAFGQLRNTEAEAKHIIVMTDGLAQSAPFDPLIEQITAADITISTVAVGRGADVSLLERMARSGGGAFHRSDDVRALPSILSQEAMLLSSNPVREGTVTPTYEPDGAVFLEDLPETFAELPGYVRTTLKPEADVHARSPDGDPILASWRHGLGRVLAVATPLQGEWADQWVETTFAGGLLRQAIRWTRAPVLKPGVNLEVRRVGDALVASARVVDDKGAAVDGARVVARADGPDGETVGPVLLANVGRGSHVGTLDAFTPGRFRVRAERTDVAAAPSADREVYVSYPSSLGYGSKRLVWSSELADATGGRVVLDPNAPLVQNTFVLDGTARIGPWASLAVACVVLAIALDALRVHVRRHSESGGASVGQSDSDAGASKARPGIS